MTGEMRTLLEQAASGDRDAEARLIEDNSGLIWSIVRRYYGRGTEPDDLYQLACVGFIKAVRGFDVSLGNEFSTYAVPKIAGEIRRFLRDDGAVKVSRAVKERAVVRNHHNASGEHFQGFFQCAQRFRIQIVRRFIKQQHIRPGFEHLGQMHAVALAAR